MAPSTATRGRILPLWAVTVEFEVGAFLDITGCQTHQEILVSVQKADQLSSAGEHLELFAVQEFFPQKGKIDREK